MDSKKMLIFGGGAAACLALGYLGFQYIEDDDDGVESSLYNEVDNVEVKEEVNKEVNKELETIKEKKNVVGETDVTETNVDNANKLTGWGQFWKNSFNENKENSKVDASDFN
tara:strand:- start:339 stop:674 length:336 start_codon:yes stop_codon:yes gene_type:complete